MPINFLWKGGDELTKTIQRRELLYTSFKRGYEVSPRSPGDNLRDIYVLSKALEVQEAVCRLNIGPSTGFMISEDVMATCHHVLGNKEEAKRCRASFDYQLDRNHMPMTAREFYLDPDSLFKTDEGLDLTIVRIKGKPLKENQWIKLASATPQVGDSAIIIQHPAFYRYKKISLGDLEIKYAGEGLLQYLSDTMPGSSGSPVFNDNFDLIGMHTDGGWGDAPSVNSRSSFFTHSQNQGIQVNTIIKFLYDNGLGNLADMAA